MARGLQFDPYGNLGFSTSYGNSVPAVAGDYNSQNWQPLSQLPIPKVTSGSPLKQAWDSFKQWSNLTDDEKEEWAIKSDPMYDINRWNNGLSGLDDSERKVWEQQNYDKISGQDEEWQDRLWRNQQFVNTLGMDMFRSMPNSDDRDKLYMDYLTSNAVKKKFGSNENIGQLLSLTPEGRMELLNSDYQSDWQMKNRDDEAKDKGWLDYSLGERWNAIASDVPEYTMAGLGTGSLIGAAFEGVGSIPGAVIGTAVGAILGAGKGIISPEDAADVNTYQRRKENDEILSKIQLADNERKKTESQDEINELFSNYLQAYNANQITESQVNQMFDNLALNGQKTQRDELGNINTVEYQGSNYYSAFKDSDEFEHFGALDKLKYIAQSQVLGQKYGQGAALQVLDQDMQQYISDNQNGWLWAGNTAKNIWVGGLANLGMNVTALGALGAQLFYGEEGLAEYLKGKDASGSGEENSWINNPQYWNKVDQYNTLGWDNWYNPFSYNEENMERPEKFGGISVYNNVYAPGSEGDFWSWSTLNESAKMSKFAWSDALKNITLGRLVRGATRMTGGVEVAPGRLATESTALSKFVNKAGAIGVLNASSLGIDAAYGMQTYEEVLRQNNEKLDKIIDKDTEAEVQKRLQTKEAMDEFRGYVDAENERRRKMAGENNPYPAVDEDQAFLDYTEHLRRVVREEQEALHQEDRQQAENDAANAYAIDASIEHLRMASTNAAFKSYLFDKGTLNALRKNNPYVDVTTRNGQYALAKHATRNAALRTAGTNIWGGFHSNYFDDVTVGFAEGFGIQDYNNYLLQKYNPAAYGSIMDDYVNPFVAAVSGATNAMQEKRSFLDGAIGAVGSGMTFAPNIGGMMSHRQRMKEAAEANKRNGQEKAGISWQEMASDFITNPILEAYANAKATTRMTEAEIKRVNDIIKENGYSFDNIVETASTLNQKAIANEGTSVMEAEDAKDREAFAIASSLLSMKNSGVVANAQAEPNKASWSKKKQAANAIGNGLNMLIGRNMFTPAESSYTNAMRALEDAATIGESNDAETQARQEELIQTFLGLDINKNVLADMSQEEQVEYAQERLKKNAANLLNMMDRTETLQKKFENSIQAQLHPDLKQQLMYQYAMNERWENRLSELEEQITGEKEREKSWVADDRRVIAQYGSMEGYERVRNAQEKRVEDAKEKYDKAQAENKKENDPTKSIVENARIKAVRTIKEKTAKQNLAKEKSKLKTIESDESILKGILESSVPGIPAEAILELPANERLRMLDDFYRDDYSAQQQNQIDRAKSILVQDDSSINEAMERVRDAAILSNRIEDNMEVAKRIMQNPIEANQMQQALIENRKRAVVDYFNDKIVAEAFNDFTYAPESTLSEEKVAEKAQNYSTAVLNGVLRGVEKELNRTKKRVISPLSDKTLTDIRDGIKSVLSQRDEKLKETADLDSYIRKTKKVAHTETVEKPLINGETGEIEEGVFTEEQVTTEKELSQNDKKLLEYALDYAAERGIPTEELSDKVMSEDFDEYVQEKNHAYELAGNPFTGEAYETNVGIVENRANPVSPEYMSSLVKDVVDAFKSSKKKVSEAKADKPTSAKPESVVTAPVETKGDKAAARDEGDARPDKPNIDASSGNIFAGLTPTNTATPSPAAKGINTDRNNQILEDASTLNSEIIDDIAVLLQEVDKISMDDRTREKIKESISAQLKSRSFHTIEELQGKILEDAMITSQAEAPQIDIKATAISALNIADIKSRRTSSNNNVNNTNTADAVNPTNPTVEDTTSPLPPMPMVLETRDLDLLINQPIWKDFIQRHNIVGFLQKLSDVWNKEVEAWRKDNKQGLLHQSQVVFIYDPALAEQVKNSIEEQGNSYNPEISAPILMALEISDKNRDLVEDEAQLISIKDKADGKTKQYQVLGIMPASQARDRDSDYMKGIASRMSVLRNRINYNDADAHVLRYAPQNDTGKYNGSIIRTNIEKVSSHTEEDRIPHATEDTPKKGAQQLMDENLSSATGAFVNATEEETQAYNDAKKQGLPAIRKTNLYKKLRKAFLDRLVKKERKGKSSDDSSNKEINFKLQKGTSDTYPKIVLVKPVGQTVDKTSGRPIVELLREVDDEGNNAKEVIESNSRFKRLFNQLSNLKLSTGLFNQAGDVINKVAFDKATRELENSIEKAIDNNLHVDDLHVRVTVSEGAPSEKTVDILVFSGDMRHYDNLLATLTTSYSSKLSEAEFASFIKDLIIDKGGNTRPGLNDSRYERVKWQVNYEDVETANDKSKTPMEKRAAINNLNDLYDDGIFEMQVTKLAYDSRSVTVGINPAMKSKLYAEEKAEPETPTPEATEVRAVDEAEGPNGKIDSDTGMATETPTKESIIKAVPRIIADTINRMLTDSATRTLADNEHYSILGQLWSRVTSIKYALEGMNGRFNPQNAWAVPSSLIGNSFDEFGRDVFNGVFDNMDEASRMAEFEGYNNSTAKNYAEGFMALKAFEARLASIGQAVIATGNKENPGHITAKGILDVAVRGQNGIETKKVRVAGTLDVLAIDSAGNLHIYDFKTHRGEFNADKAIEKGYDRQLSMYAKFLEDEYGLKVASINIIPIKADYPIPSGVDNDGNAIRGAQKTYRQSRPGSNQLEIKDPTADDSKYEPYTGANFKVEREIPLTRLSDAQLVASFEKMTDAEKESIVEAIQDQNDTPATTAEVKSEDIADAKPENITVEEEEEEGGRSRKGRLGRRKSSNSTAESLEEVAQAINPKDKNGLLNRLEDLEKACGGKKTK